jgi:hypothetical protein
MKTPKKVMAKQQDNHEKEVARWIAAYTPLVQKLLALASTLPVGPHADLDAHGNRSKPYLDAAQKGIELLMAEPDLLWQDKATLKQLMLQSVGFVDIVLHGLEKSWMDRMAQAAGKDYLQALTVQDYDGICRDLEEIAKNKKKK